MLESLVITAVLFVFYNKKVAIVTNLLVTAKLLNYSLKSISNFFDAFVLLKQALLQVYLLTLILYNHSP